jgi:hypothetical protein
MEFARLLTCLETDVAGLREAAAGNLDAPVPTPNWPGARPVRSRPTSRSTGSRRCSSASCATGLGDGRVTVSGDRDLVAGLRRLLLDATQ